MHDDERLERARAEQILARAALLAAEDSKQSMTLGELTAAAQDVGFDAGLVRRAADEIEVDAAQSGRTLGMQTRVIRRRVLARRFDAAGLRRVMARLDGEFATQGTRTVDDDTASWNARHIQVTLEPSVDGGTIVQISERFANTASQRGTLAIGGGGFWGLISGLLLAKALGLATALSIPLALALVFLFTMVTLRLARRAHAKTIARTGESFERVLDAIERTAEHLGLPESRG